MGLRQLRRKVHMDRRLMLKRFERHRRINLLALPGQHEFVIILDNLKPNFNVAKIFRSADAFGARAVYLVGIDWFDPAPAKGSFKWVPARFFKTVPECLQHAASEGYTPYMLDPETEHCITKATLPVRSAFIFGHEEFGFSFNPDDYPAIQKMAVPQFGKVQSLNVSIAASIVMYEYVRQHHGE